MSATLGAMCNDLCNLLLASELPAGGTYSVVLWLPAPAWIAVGRLGQHRFPGGLYTYTGSARRGLRARLHRHVHGATTRHWHLDYLRPHVRVAGWQVYADASQPECQLNGRLARYGQVVVPRFGSSDCRCASHLLYYPGPWGPPGRVAGLARLLSAAVEHARITPHDGA